MGWAQRINPGATPKAKQRRTNDARLRAMLALFPDRATFEQWVTAKAVPDDLRAHLESFLPAHLQQEEAAIG